MNRRRKLTALSTRSRLRRTELNSRVRRQGGCGARSKALGCRDPSLACTGVARLPSTGFAEASVADSHRSCQRRHPVAEQEGEPAWATHPGTLVGGEGQRLRVLAFG